MPPEIAPDHTKEYSVIINGRARTIAARDVTFEELLALAFTPLPSGPNWVFTVPFRRGHGDKPEGSLSSGSTVKVKEGMVFNVTATDKS